MKLVIISDTHGYLRERDIPDGDVLIHCGDACSSGQGFEFLHFAGQMHKIAARFRLVLFTPGNHDRCVQAFPDKCRQVFENQRCKMLIHESTEFEGVKFFGSPWTPAFLNWSYMYDRAKGKELWSTIPNDTEVLFTHGMPYGILDSIGRLIGKEGDEHVGCKDLLERIGEIKPKIFAGGHLHLQGGRQFQNIDTLFVNAAICDDSYSPTRKPFEIEI